jgi:hypothetical protein
MNDSELLRAWTDHIFDHVLAEPQWYWADDAPVWSGPMQQIPELIAETFERSGCLLERFSDDSSSRVFGI